MEFAHKEMIMAKPVIWTVDDDPDVLRAVERDLRRQYGNRYRVMAADSGASALAAVEQLKLRNEPVALFKPFAWPCRPLIKDQKATPPCKAQP